MTIQERFDAWFPGGLVFQQEHPDAGPTHFAGAVHVVAEDPLALYLADADTEGLDYLLVGCQVSDDQYDAKKFVYVRVASGMWAGSVWRLRGDVPARPGAVTEDLDWRPDALVGQREALAELQESAS